MIVPVAIPAIALRLDQWLHGDHEDHQRDEEVGNPRPQHPRAQPRPMIHGAECASVAARRTPCGE